MGVDFQSDESFNLPNNPAGFLPVCDIVDQREILTSLCLQADAIGPAKRVGALQSHSCDNALNVAERNLAWRSASQHFAFRNYLAGADHNARAAERALKERVDGNQIKKPEYHGKKPRCLRERKKINNAGPNRRE